MSLLAEGGVFTSNVASISCSMSCGSYVLQDSKYCRFVTAAASGTANRLAVPPETLPSVGESVFGVLGLFWLLRPMRLGGVRIDVSSISAICSLKRGDRGPDAEEIGRAIGVLSSMVTSSAEGFPGCK